MSFKPLSCHFNPLSCALPGVDRVNSGIFPFPQNICMLNFVCLPSLHRQSSEQTAASSRPLVRQLMCGHGSLSRLAGPVCVRAVQTLRGCRAHQRLLRQLSSPFASGQALRGPPQKGLPTPTGRHTETEGSVYTCRHLLNLDTGSLFARALFPLAVCCHDLKHTHPDYLSDAGNQQQNPNLHFKKAKSRLRVGHRTQPPTERRTEGSIQGTRDNGAR